jgi:hypothetical protein
MKNFVAPVLFALATGWLHVTCAQGTFIYDQQSAGENAPGEAVVGIQANQPLGQSFTPSLSAINFIRLQLTDGAINGLGATVFVNLCSTSISGLILGATAPVSMPDGFSGYTNFFFEMPVSLTPGVQYFFQPMVQSGDQWGVAGYNPVFNYPGGTLIYRGSPSPASDLWFREGIYNVPEPSAGVFVLLGTAWFRWRRRRVNP